MRTRRGPPQFRGHCRRVDSQGRTSEYHYLESGVSRTGGDGQKPYTVRPGRGISRRLDQQSINLCVKQCQEAAISET